MLTQVLTRSVVSLHYDLRLIIDGQSVHQPCRAMSFITLDDRAFRIHERASTAGTFAVTAAIFYSQTRKAMPSLGWKNGSLTVTARASILVLAVSALGLLALPEARSTTGRDFLVGLHPTCSFDHDCWVATARSAGADKARATNRPERVDLAVSRNIVDRDPESGAGRNAPSSFGTLVPPTTNWSGSPQSPRVSESTRPLPTDRLVAAVPAPSDRLAATRSRASQPKKPGSQAGGLHRVSSSRPVWRLSSR